MEVDHIQVEMYKDTRNETIYKEIRTGLLLITTSRKYVLCIGKLVDNLPTTLTSSDKIVCDKMDIIYCPSSFK